MRSFAKLANCRKSDAPRRHRSLARRHQRPSDAVAGFFLPENHVATLEPIAARPELIAAAARSIMTARRISSLHARRHDLRMRMIIGTESTHAPSSIWTSERHPMSASPSRPSSASSLPKSLQLGQCAKGWRGIITALSGAELPALTWIELERQLLEMGFVEGARVEICHEGPFSGDPIAVRLDDATIAIRRRDAAAILVCTMEQLP
jgi:ferrous iron transport protein A